MKSLFIISIAALLTLVDYSLADQTSLNEDNDDAKLPLVCNKNKKGCIRGIYMPGFRAKAYEAFLGIPFAEPPINKLRFANPKPIDAWTTTIIADTEKDMCIQKNYFAPGNPVSGSEDCLYLNVYRPKKANRSRKPLPVVVFIYGGGFFSGSAGPSFEGAQYFMDTEKVIMVTMAYRLGAFGFLSTGDKFMPGNFGYKDQVVALKWINQNIKYFNGNPKLVTLFGQSAGGASVNYQMLSKLSKGLFQRAGLLSGVSLAPFAKIEYHPLEVARKQAKYVGISNYKTLSTEQLTKELRKVDALALLNSGDSFKRFSIYPLEIFRTVIEDANNPNSFLTNDPKILMENGEVNYVPLLISFVDNEGFPAVAKLLTNSTLLSELNENLLKFLPDILFLNDDPERIKTRIINNVIKYYFDRQLTLNEDNKLVLNQAITDYGLVSLYDTLKLYTKHMPPTTPVNIIKFSFKGRYSLSQRFSTMDFGVVHGDDLIYYFNQPALFPALEINSPEARASEVIIQLFVKFAKTGVPEKYVPIDDCKFDRIASKKFCDYQHILRKGDDVQVKSDNRFNFNILRIWR